MESTPQPPARRSTAPLRDPLSKVLGTTGTSPTQRIPSVVGRQLLEYVLERPSAPALAVQGRILIVDHDELSRDFLARNLLRENFNVELEEDGLRALTRLDQEKFDLVLWAVQLPGLGGLEMLKRTRQDEKLQHIPMVLLSEVNDVDLVVQCMSVGASDYLPKPFNPALLKARIRSCLERKYMRDQEQRLLADIQGYKERISLELADAKAYLQSLLPQPQRDPFLVDWRFLPSSELGGDSFGYHWIDDDHFALYLLDVCGHGVGAALLSVTALNVLRSNTFHDVDFRDPAQVLAALNEAFPMEKHNNRYFTLWYGVYQRSTRQLTYSSGGHPPALLFAPGEVSAIRLSTRGLMIGAIAGRRFTAQTCDVPVGSRLFLFCDGAYEITLPDGRVYTLDEFALELGQWPAERPIDLDVIIGRIHRRRGSGELEDDLSLMAIQF